MRRVKKKQHENLSDERLTEVIGLLGSSTTDRKPITKKEACEMLNIAYNTTRLNKIIEEFVDQQEYRKARKAKLRGKPVSEAEIAEIAMDYLQGDSLASISKSVYRPAALIKSVVEKIGIPSRPANKAERVHTELLPQPCVAESFEPGEIVWSAQHHCAAEIREEISVDHQAEKQGFSDVNYEEKYSSRCYAIWVLESIDQDKEFWINGVEAGGYNAYALAYDLGKLEHLQQFGVDLSRL
jgi:hypothetical protein